MPNKFDLFLSYRFPGGGSRLSGWGSSHLRRRLSDHPCYPFKSSPSWIVSLIILSQDSLINLWWSATAYTSRKFILLKRLLGFRWKRRIGGGRARTAGEGFRMSGGNLPTSSVTSTCSHCQAGYWLLAPNSLLVASNSFPFNQFLFRRLNRPWSTSFHCQMERRSSVQNPALQHIGALYRHDVDLSEHTTQY